MKNITNHNGDIVIYQSEDGNTRINVNLQDETVWLSQQQLVELYQTSKSNISEHIKHIFEEGELTESLVVRKFRITFIEKVGLTEVKSSALKFCYAVIKEKQNG